MSRAVVIAAVVLAGCADAVVAEHEANVATGPGVAQLGFAELGESPDLVAGAPARAQVDVARRLGDRWEPVGSFFAANHEVRAIVPASIGGRPTVVVLGGTDEVTLLGSDLLDPHRLRPPVRMYQGSPRVIAAGDLDHDGIDEVVVGTGDRVELIDDTEWALFEDPSEDPSVDVRGIDDFPAGVLAVAELTGDAVLDVVAFHREQGTARVYDAPGVDHEGRQNRDLDLPATAVSAAVTTCARAPVVAVLEDGSIVGIPRDADAELVHWPVAGDARAIFSGGDSAVVVYRDGAPMTLHSACGTDSGALDLSSEDVLSVALTPRRSDTRRLAIARESDAAISVFRVEAPF